MAHRAPTRLQKRHQGVWPRQESEANPAATPIFDEGFPKRVESSKKVEVVPPSTSFSTSESTSSSSTASTSTWVSTQPSTTSSTASPSPLPTTSSTATSSETSSSISSAPVSAGSSIPSSSSSIKTSQATSSPSTVRSTAPTQQFSNNLIPTTTFTMGSYTSPSDRPSSLPTAAETGIADSSSGRGFLANKAAMAGTFSVVGLVGVGVLLVALFTLWKKRSAFTPGSRVMRDDESFKNFTMVEPETAESSNGHESYYSHGDHPTADLASHTPMDPFATSGPVYPAAAQYGSSHSLANPFTDPAPSHSSHNYSRQPSNQSLRDDQYMAYSGTTIDMPAPSRKVLARSSVQPSIDSFYGAAY